MTADEILSHYELEIGTASRAAVSRAHSYANEEGTIQECDAFKLFNEPTLWTCMTLETALFHLGCRETEEAIAQGNADAAEAQRSRQEAAARQVAQMGYFRVCSTSAMRAKGVRLLAVTRVANVIRTVTVETPRVTKTMEFWQIQQAARQVDNGDGLVPLYREIEDACDSFPGTNPIKYLS